jgi:hypothetical protein
MAAGTPRAGGRRLASPAPSLFSPSILLLQQTLTVARRILLKQ